jgi:hypothetical protein
VGGEFVACESAPTKNTHESRSDKRRLQCPHGFPIPSAKGIRRLIGQDMLWALSNWPLGAQLKLLSDMISVK